MEDLFVTGSRRIYNKKPITSLQGYLDHVDQLIETWGQRELWFRGQSEDFDLKPGLYRPMTTPADHYRASQISREFIRKAKAFLPESESKWHWYHLMQHYGLPTRLLDWTEGALIGLFFAVRNQEGSSDPCVWVLNPWWLNSKSAEEESIFFADDISQTPEDKELVDRYLYDSEELPDFPISISPPHVNRRITAQIAGFTVHGSIKSGLNDLWEGDEGKQLAQLTINREDLKSLIGEVSMCGIKESIIFPDLDGLSREMKRDYGLGQPFSGD